MIRLAMLVGRIASRATFAERKATMTKGDYDFSPRRKRLQLRVFLGAVSWPKGTQGE